MTHSSVQSSPSMADDQRSMWPTAFAMAAGVIVLYALASSATTLFDRDEPRFAQAAVEMIATGNWLYPTFDRELRPDKPILIYWLMSLPVRLVGETDWAFRMPSAIGVGIAMLATFGCARRFISDRAALLAMLMLATAPLTMMIGTAATADGWLLGMTTAAIAAFVYAVLAESKRTSLAWLAMLALLCGLAQLTKGPVALAVVGFPVLGTLAFGWRRLATVRWLALPSVLALALSVGIFLAWAIPANATTQGEFAARGLGTHVVSRVLAPMEGHGGNFFLTLPYYIPVVAAGFFPWIIFLPGAFAQLMGRQNHDASDARGRRVRIVLLTWSVPTFVMMSLVATKLPHYVLPIWPALAIMVAHHLQSRAVQQPRWIKASNVLLIVLGSIGVLGFVAAALAIDDISMLAGGLLTAFFLGATVLTGVLYLKVRRPFAAAVVLGVGMLATQQVVAHRLLRPFEQYKLAPQVATAIKARTEIDTGVLSVRFGEPSLVRTLWPTRVQIEGSLGAIASWKAQRGPGVLVVPLDELDDPELRDPQPESRLEVIATIEGFNYSTGDWVTLAVIGRELEPSNASAPRDLNAR